MFDDGRWLNVSRVSASGATTLAMCRAITSNPGPGPRAVSIWDPDRPTGEPVCPVYESRMDEHDMTPLQVLQIFGRLIKRGVGGARP
jgi:hypothetical protein